MYFFCFQGIRSIYNISNTKAMMTTLNRIREENATSEESRTYYSILRTGYMKNANNFSYSKYKDDIKYFILGQLIPYDSAIFLSTDTLPNDPEHQESASMILLKKRIRVSRKLNSYFIFAPLSD